MSFEYDGMVVEAIPVVPGGNPIPKLAYTLGECLFIVFGVSRLEDTLGVDIVITQADEPIVVEAAPEG